MNIAGQVRLLTDEHMDTIHEKACELLSKKGIVFESEASLEVFKQHGMKVEGSTVFLDKQTVEKCVEQTPSSFVLEAMDADRSVVVGEGLLIHPAGGEVAIADYKGPRRAPLMKDFANLQKLYQACDSIHIAGFQPLSPTDVPDRLKGLYCTFESMKHSSKPILSPMELETIQKKEEVLKLFDVAYGTEGYLKDHYLTWHAVCPNSPYIYSDFACEGIHVYAEQNQPVIIVSAPMSGITSPVYLLSTVILSIAEELAGLVLAQLIQPGVPVVLSASQTYGYLKYATWECASPDSSLMLAAVIQMCREYYKLPARAQTGVTSSKTVDYQAGMETMQSLLYTALAGVNLTSQSVGTLGNLLTSSLEKTVLDDELVSRVQHLLTGWVFNEEQMGIEELLEASPGEDFLMSDATIMRMRDYWTPTVSDWNNTDDWTKLGEKDVVEHAHVRVEQILGEAPESLLESEQEKAMLDYIKSVETSA